MKYTKLVYLSIFIFIFALFIMMLSSDNTTAYELHSPITINSNDDFESQGWPGNGTEANPWVIANLEINSSINTPCIYVGNVTDYFEVRGCFLTSSHLNPLNILSYWMHDTQFGLIVDGSYYGNITNNVISNQNYGIFIDGMTSKDLYCEHMDICNNTFINNTNGVYVTYSVYDYDEKIDVNDNNFSYNSIGMLGGLDSTFNNIMGNSFWKNDFGIVNASASEIARNTFTYNGVGIIGYSDSFRFNMLDSNNYGMIWEGSQSFICNNQFSRNNVSMQIGGDSYCIQGNVIHNSSIGIALGSDTSPTFRSFICDNRIFDNSFGIQMGNDCYWNIIKNNHIQNNDVGFSNIVSNENQIYHNNFIDNSVQASDGGDNAWDNGPRSGGNYWNDYGGVQNSEGIGVKDYVISDGDNQDNHPLMNQFDNQYPERIIEENYWLPLVLIAAFFCLFAYESLVLLKRVKPIHEILWKYRRSILAISMGAIAILSLYSYNNASYVSAFELKDEADEIAREWKEDATLTRISSAYDNIRNGRSKTWSYTYYSASSTTIFNEQEQFEVLYLTISHDGRVTRHVTDTQGSYHMIPLNLTIDSDEAFYQALTDYEVEEFDSEFPDAGIYMNAQADWAVQGWNIEYTANYGPDEDFNHVDIYIDGETGQIMGTDVSSHQHGFQYACYGCYAVILIVVVLILLMVVRAVKKHNDIKPPSKEQPLP